MSGFSSDGAAHEGDGKMPVADGGINHAVNDPKTTLNGQQYNSVKQSLKAPSTKMRGILFSRFYPSKESGEILCEDFFQCVIKYAGFYKQRGHVRVSKLDGTGGPEINKILQITKQNVDFFEKKAAQIEVESQDKFPKLLEYRSNPEFPETCRSITYSLMKELNKFIEDIRARMTNGNLYQKWEKLDCTPVLNRHIAPYLREIPRKAHAAVASMVIADDGVDSNDIQLKFEDNGSIEWLDDHPRERALYQLVRATILPMTTLQGEIKSIETQSIPFDTKINKSNPCYLYSGQSKYLFDNDDNFNEFLAGNQNVNNFITSWSIDARVACHFADIQDNNEIINREVIKYLKEKNETESKFIAHTKYKLLFAYKCNSEEQIPFVSPSSSWEAEVCMSASSLMYESIGCIDSYDDTCIILLIIVTRRANTFNLPDIRKLNKYLLSDPDLLIALRFGEELYSSVENIRRDVNDLNASIISKLVTTKMYKQKTIGNTTDGAPEDAIRLKRVDTDQDCDHDVENVMVIQRRYTPQVLEIHQTHTLPEEMCSLKRCDAIQGTSSASVGTLGKLERRRFGFFGTAPASAPAPVGKLGSSEVGSNWMSWLSTAPTEPVFQGIVPEDSVPEDSVPEDSGGRRNKNITSTRKYNKKTKHLHKQPNSHKKHKYTKKSHKKHKYTKRTYKKTHRRKTHRRKTHRHYKNNT
jgi:hypothetical protein